MAWYDWVKAVHVIAVISWMAGLLYLPRLFVYHCDAKAGSVMSETFKVMERRLFRAIMTPAMVVSWGAGLAMIFLAGSEWISGSGWLHIKLGLVVLLTGCHVYLGVLVSAFARDANKHGGRFYRVLNEVPTLIMVLVVVLVIVKPF